MSERRLFVEKHLLILTHGRFGEELLRSVEMIVGPVENAATISLMPGMPPEVFQAEVEKLVGTIDKDKEILCLVDLFGGSPCNIALRVNYDRPLKIVSGLSLPLLIEAVSQREYLEMDELVETMVQSAQMGCFDVLKTKKVEG